MPDYDIDKIRAQMKKLAGKPQDPFMYQPPKAKDGETIKHRFFVLPPLQKGDKCYGGTMSKDMDLTYCIKHGNHWVNNKPYPCPRILIDETCELCQAGFDLLNETTNKDKRAAIVKQFLSQTYYAVNVYFPPFDTNPEELRDKVLWMNAQKTLFDIWQKAINRDSGGDAEDPEAFGVFYNEMNAFLFQIQIEQSGTFNDYRTSKFLAKMGPTSIAVKDKKPDEKKIQKILDSRHDLWLKIERPNPQKIHQLCQVILHGDDTAMVDDEQPKVASESAAVDAEVSVAKEEKSKPKAKATPKPEPVKAKVETAVETTSDDDDNIDAILAKLGSSDD